MSTVYMTHTRTQEGVHVQMIANGSQLAAFERGCRAVGVFTQQLKITTENNQDDVLVLAVSHQAIDVPAADVVYLDCVKWLVDQRLASRPSGAVTRAIVLTQRQCSHVGCCNHALYTLRMELRPGANIKPAVTDVNIYMCAEHQDVTWEDIMPDEQWRRLRAEFAAKGFAMPKRQYSNLVIVPIA